MAGAEGRVSGVGFRVSERECKIASLRLGVFAFTIIPGE